MYTGASNASNGPNARARQLRYNNMILWRLPVVIASIPIFLHIAFFLFFAGLVVLLLFDNAEIAYSVLTLVLIVAILYLLITLVPIVFPHCPFKTPISDFISDSLLKLYTVVVRPSLFCFELL